LLITPSKSFFMTGNGSYLGFNDIDLSGIRQIEFEVMVTPSSGAIGGTIEIHLDAPDGKLIGQTTILSPKAVDYARVFEMIGGKGKAGAAAKGKGVDKKTDSKKKAGSAADFDFDMFRKMLSVKAQATLEPVDGVHKVYIVCKNPKAGDSEILMDMIGINFQNQIPPAAPVASK
jgi:cytochrome c